MNCIINNIFLECNTSVLNSSVFIGVINALLMLVPLLITVAFFTLAERKVMAAVQRRKGPQVVGFWGFLQPFADALKLIIKETVVPSKANHIFFFAAPCITLVLSFISWAVIPFGYSVSLYGVPSLLYVLVVSSFGVYGIVLAGWASNSKYAFFGGLRAIAQMISYELTISLICLPIILLSGSLCLLKIIYIQKLAGCYITTIFPLAPIFLTAIFAETNRAPFDLPEAEAELVAGYNVEYSAIAFTAFFLGEYSNILLMSSLFIIFFFGGFVSSFMKDSAFMFSFSTVGVCFLFIFIRANLPRLRFDQLMWIGWKCFLPITIGFLVFLLGILIFFNSVIINQTLI